MGSAGVTTNCTEGDDAPALETDRNDRSAGAGSDDRLTPGTEGDDPRTTGEFVRTAPGSDGAGELHLVGVVHGHPASCHRVGAVVDAVSPDVVGLELPPIALPLYEQRAEAGDGESLAGGEMSAAIRAAPEATVAGIDGPSLRFSTRLARTLLSERASRSTTASVLRSFAGVTRVALGCRVAAARRSIGVRPGVGVGNEGEVRNGDRSGNGGGVGSGNGNEVGNGNGVEKGDGAGDGNEAGAGVHVPIGSDAGHDASPADDPATQAADERDHVRRGTALRGLLSPSPASRLRTTAREEHMIDRLTALRSRGTVVAVVGIDHLDAVAEGVGAERPPR